MDGVTYPFAAGDFEPYALSDQADWGWRVHPIHGDTRWHAGIDLAAPQGTPARTVAGGSVVFAGDVNGYGYTVVVETATGHREQFAHLSEIHVGLDDVIQPGGAIGLVGSTGMSTGPHLDFVVYKPGFGILDGNYQESTMNPIEYLQQVNPVQVQPLGLGAPPAATEYVPDPNASPLDRLIAQYNHAAGLLEVGAYTAPADEYYNAATPQQTGLAALSREAYRVNGVIQNNPSNNYGYRQLADDTSYRVGLAEIASNLGIPAQWLADIIDYETIGTHDPGIVNPYGCVGLIQFCPGGGLSDIAQEWGISVSAATNRLASMSAAEQLNWVYYYLNRYKDFGPGLNTIEDVYALVNAGIGGYDQTPEGRRNGFHDGNGGLPDHFRQLGRRAGRRYESSYDRYQSNAGHTHVSVVPGCPECNRMLAAFGTIYPHGDPNV
jgi:hypothetical protein